MTVSKTGLVTDPSTLTTQQLNVAIVGLRDLTDARFEALDTALKLLQHSSDLRPTTGEVAIKTEEKFLALAEKLADVLELGKLYAAQISSVHATRIDALEKRLDHKYVETASDIGHLRDLVMEKVEGIDSQLTNRLNDRFILTDQVYREHFFKIDQQFIDSKDATALALSAADKAISNAYGTAEKAVAKVELAAEKGYLESQIASLRESFISQIRTQKDALEAALAASDKAVQKAETSSEKRFESVNEFRATLSDQQMMLATKNEVNLRFTALEDRMGALVEDSREARGSLVGKNDLAATARANISLVVALGVGLLVLLTFLRGATLGH